MKGNQPVTNCNHLKKVVGIVRNCSDLDLNMGTTCPHIQIGEPVTNCHGLDSHDKLMKLKDSGIPWIGLIPEQWNVGKIKNLLNVFSGATPKSDNPYFWDGNIAWITPADFKTEQKTVSKGRKSITQAGYNSCGTILLPEDSIIFSKRAPIGSVVIAANPLCTNQGCLGCVSKGDCVPKYYYYLFGVLGKEFETFGTGTTFMEISYSDFVNFAIPVPPLAEQERIAAWLDGKCREIDELIDIEQQMISDLEAYRQAVISEAVTHGLNPNINVKNSTVYWIGLVPNHWDIAKMKYFVQISNGSDPKTEGEIPVYGSGANSFKTCGESKDGPTVLIGRKGATLHIPHYIEGKYWNVDTAFDTKMKEYDLRYFYYLAGILDYKAYISATTLPSMTQSNYENMLIPIPPLSEQREIAEYLDAKCTEIDELIKIKQEKIEALKEYRQSLIFEAVTGKTSIN